MRTHLAEKIDEIDERIAAMQVARARLGHALTCEHESLLDCPTRRAGLRDVLADRVDGHLRGAQANT